MNDNPENAGHVAAKASHRHHAIEVAGVDLNYRAVEIDDPTPTGHQIAHAASIKPPDSAIVLQVFPDGAMDVVDPDDTVDIRGGDARFVVVASDRVYFFTVDGERYDWPVEIITGATIRKLAGFPEDMALYFERTDRPDREVGANDAVNLDHEGIESLITRKAIWKLKVQNVVLELTTFSINVRDALVQAGFNPDQGWLIFLKVAGQKKQPVELSTEIDLRMPGIEKLRLTPNEINNGEAPPEPCRDFALLEADEDHLNRLDLRWETIVEQKRRWLLIHGYPLPTGYTVERTKLALEVPPDYPGAQIYGFYAYPPLALTSGHTIERTQLRGILLGVEFHGWSRNRGRSAPWNPAVDNVISHLTLVEAALAKEVDE